MQNFSILRFFSAVGAWSGCGLAIALTLSSCSSASSSLPVALPDSVRVSSNQTNALNISDLLQESWQAYRQRFIQADGRVIDREAADRSTSEGQAYAMLRAVLMNDPETFERVLNWGENNLQRRRADGSRSDMLWAWKWGQDDKGNWGPVDANFASDGDLDATTALILASRRWNRPDYLDLARNKLQDLWNLSTVEDQKQTRYFLPGAQTVFQRPGDRVFLNPSYLAPYAFRIFAQVDSSHDWQSLVDSSYQVLNESAKLSTVGLPSDWILLDRTTGTFSATTDAKLQSIYGFDAYRVWWRISLDAELFNESRATQFLQQHLQPLQEKWRSQKSIPAQLDLQGNAMVNYESTAQYAMLHAALQGTDPEMAEQIRQQKLLSTYRAGFWDGDTAYYSQNLAWFGLFSPNEIKTWFRP
jgi:endoglucanase